MQKNALILPRDTFHSLAGLVFLVAGVIHITRAFYVWDMSVNGWMIPVWISWVTGFLTLTLAYNALVGLK